MVKLTESLYQYMWRYHREDIVPLRFGHTEVVDPWWEEYLAWCQTDGGKRYLEGGDLYRPVQ